MTEEQKINTGTKLAIFLEHLVEEIEQIKSDQDVLRKDIQILAEYVENEQNE